MVRAIWPRGSRSHGVLVSDSGTPKELVGPSGLVFPEGNATELARLLRRALTNRIDCVGRRKAAIRHVHRHLSVDVEARMYLDLFKQVVMMRLLMPVADYGASGSLSTSYVRGLKDTPCAISEVRLDQRPRNWIGDVALRAQRRLVPHIGYREANARLLAETHRVKPDVVWLFKGMEIYPRTLRRLRRDNIILVNYNADHPFEFFSRGSGNENVRGSIPEYHLHITYSQHIAQQMRDAYPGIAVTVIPFGHDVDEETYRAIASVEEIPRAAFVGNPDEYRRRNLLTLAAAGLPIDVFGHGWERFLHPTAQLRLMGPLGWDDMLRALRAYRVQLNFFRPHNVHSHNMRTFEVPACGGIMLAEDSIEHRAFFESGKEAFYFGSEQEMIVRTRELLALRKAEADCIRIAARQRCVTGNYSYRDRALKVLSEITRLVRMN